MHPISRPDYGELGLAMTILEDLGKSCESCEITAILKKTMENATNKIRETAATSSFLLEKK